MSLMDTKETDAERDTPQFRIGAVERMTGIPAITIRMWERRHQAVVPARTEKNGRLYTRAQVARLDLLRRLVDSGNAISTIADLDDEALLERLEPGQLHRRSKDAPLNILLCGKRLIRGWNQAGVFQGIDLAITANSLDEAAAADSTTVDLAVVELDLVTPGSARRIQALQSRFRCQQIVVLYHFATRRDLAPLATLGAITLKAPIAMPELRQLIVAVAGISQPVAERPGVTGALLGELPERLYSDEELSALAAQSSSVRCECPQHLADLITKLGAFEAYSRHCESQNPADASLHMLLHASAARARGMMEQGLQRLIELEFDGKIPDAQ